MYISAVNIASVFERFTDLIVLNPKLNGKNVDLLCTLSITINIKKATSYQWHSRINGTNYGANWEITVN
jgi:hypothetical protein